MAKHTKTKFVNMGRSPKNPYAIVVYAYEEESPLPRGRFHGFIKRDKVALYPLDLITKSNYKGWELDITIYDLKARSSVC